MPPAGGDAVCVFIAAASLVSLLSGVALTLGFTAAALETVPDDGSDALLEVAAQLKKTGVRLDRVERVLERELSATRRDVREVLDARALGDVGTESRRTPRAAAAADSGLPTASTHVTRDETEPMSSKNVAALGPLADWKTDEGLRSQWLFASEKASLDAFGTPDEVAARGTSEWWTYWNVVEGDTIASEYRLKFNNGRLVEASLVKWKTPRRLPTAER